MSARYFIFFLHNLIVGLQVSVYPIFSSHFWSNNVIKKYRYFVIESWFYVKILRLFHLFLYSFLLSGKDLDAWFLNSIGIVYDFHSVYGNKSVYEERGRPVVGLWLARFLTPVDAPVNIRYLRWNYNFSKQFLKNKIFARKIASHEFVIVLLLL